MLPRNGLTHRVTQSAVRRPTRVRALRVTFLARSWRPPRAILGAPPLQGGRGGAIQRKGSSFITRNQSQRLPSLRTGTPVTPVCAADAHLQRRRRGGARRLRPSQGRSPLRSQARRSCWSRRSRLKKKGATRTSPRQAERTQARTTHRHWPCRLRCTTRRL